MARATSLNRPNVSMAAKDSTGRKNLALEQTLLNIQSNVEQLQQKTGLAGYDSAANTPVNPPPKKAGLAVSVPSKGNIAVMLTNPEYLNPRHNPLRTPLIHEVSYSTNPTFAVTGAITKLPPTTQAHFSFPISGTYYIRLRSSFDGEHWNDYQVSSPVSA